MNLASILPRSAPLRSCGARLRNTSQPLAWDLGCAHSRESSALVVPIVIVLTGSDEFSKMPGQGESLEGCA